MAEPAPIAGLCILLVGCFAESTPAPPTAASVPEVASSGPLVAQADGAVLPVAPVHALRRACHDRRFPRLVGPWAIGCGPDGAVDLAVDLRTNALITLASPVDTPGVGEAVLFAPGLDGGLWTLPGTLPEPVKITAGVHTIAPTAVLGRRIALLAKGQVSAFDAASFQRAVHDADPVPWYPPALTPTWMAWVDGRDRTRTGLDIWSLQLPDGRRPVALCQDPGDQRHVVASGDRIGWVDAEGLWIQEMATGTRQHVRAETGFRAAPTLTPTAACWEERDASDVDVVCSDGISIRGPGDQGWPTRYDPWLFFRDEGVPKVALVSARSPGASP